MRVILQVMAGPSSGRQIPLQVGEVARFGRHDTADVCFSDDMQMSDVHFEIHCGAEQCLLRDLTDTEATLLNGDPTSQVELQNGDVISAGQSSFTVVIQDAAPAKQASEAAVQADDSGEPAEPEPLTTAELCTLLELDESAQQLLTAEHTPPSFVETLAAHEHFADAIKLLAFHLPKREAIWWGYHCLRELSGESDSPSDQAVMTACLDWITEPNEEHRRAAHAAAEDGEFESPACWIALAIFWSGGSLAPPELPEVPPDEKLTSQGITAALMMSATAGDPTQSQDKYRQFIQSGQKVLVGDLPLPQ